MSSTRNTKRKNSLSKMIDKLKRITFLYTLLLMNCIDVKMLTFLVFFFFLDEADDCQNICPVHPPAGFKGKSTMMLVKFNHSLDA